LALIAGDIRGLASLTDDAFDLEVTRGPQYGRPVAVNMLHEPDRFRLAGQELGQSRFALDERHFQHRFAVEVHKIEREVHECFVAPGCLHQPERGDACLRV